jgi:enoyl-CoA hydratase/3-hydroxyacyl-CoA dehydrogenase
VVPLDRLYDEAEALAQRLAAGPPVALRVAKRAMNEGSQLPLMEGLRMEAESFGALAETEDLVEGISAFFERREPEFKGK